MNQNKYGCTGCNSLYSAVYGRIQEGMLYRCRSCSQLYQAKAGKVVPVTIELRIENVEG